MFSIIVAQDKERGIGKNGTIPWYCSADFKNMHRVTTHTTDSSKMNALVMGRKTWESIPPERRPLAKRLSAVITSRADIGAPSEVLLFTSLAEAVTVLERRPEIETIFVFGGEQLFQEAIVRPDCAILYVTEIDQSFACDTFFPEIPPEFNITEQSDWMQEGEIKYRFLTYGKFH